MKEMSGRIPKSTTHKKYVNFSYRRQQNPLTPPHLIFTVNPVQLTTTELLIVEHN